MIKMLEFLSKKAFNEVIAFLFLIIGVTLGLILAWVILKVFSDKNIKQKPCKQVVCVDEIKEKAIDIFLSKLTKFENEKITLFSGATTYLLEEIPKIYNNKTKFYTVIKNNDFSFIKQDVKICLDFTVYEGVYFIRSLICSLEKCANDILETGMVKVAYGVSRSTVNTLSGKNFPPKVGDCNIKDILTVLKFKGKIRVKTQSKCKKGFFKSVIEKVLKRATDTVVDRANCAVDEHIAWLLDIVAEELNLLYSDSFRRGIASLDSFSMLGFDGEKR